MKDTIDKLVDIDNQSRAVINKCEEKEEIDENTKKVIQDIQNDYNEKKDEKINEMIEKILR